MSGEVPGESLQGPVTIQVPWRPAINVNGPAFVVADGRCALVSYAGNSSHPDSLAYWDVDTGVRRNLVDACPEGGVGPAAVAGVGAAYTCAYGPYGHGMHVWHPHSSKSARLAKTVGGPSRMNAHGDGSLLVLNTGLKEGASLWRVVGFHKQLLRAGPDANPVVDVDRGRIAIRRTAGIDLRGVRGQLLD